MCEKKSDVGMASLWSASEGEGGQQEVARLGGGARRGEGGLTLG